MKKILILILIFLGLSSFAEVNNTSDSVSVTNDYFYQKNTEATGLDYDNYIDDPSQAVYNATQNQYIYDNYGSSASMEYLNRGDAGNYNGGSDFDRNY